MLERLRFRSLSLCLAAAPAPPVHIEIATNRPVTIITLIVAPHAARSVRMYPRRSRLESIAVVHPRRRSRA